MTEHKKASHNQVLTYFPVKKSIAVNVGASAATATEATKAAQHTNANPMRGMFGGSKN
jgi:hypothetical protein